MQANRTAQRIPLVVIGAGAAGLAAAHAATERGIPVLVLERSRHLGGLARTVCWKGYRFDIGGHRFLTRLDQIEELWKAILGADLLTVSRLSRIYYRGRFFQYPLQLLDTLAKLGPVESMAIMLSYLQARIHPKHPETTFEQWIVNRFGRRLYDHFFRVYTEKVWGRPGSQIQADWAAQRIRNLSLSKALAQAVTQRPQARSLSTTFYYPRLGAGMFFERLAQTIRERGGEILLGAEVVGIEVQHDGTTRLRARQGTQQHILLAEHVISSMPLPELISRLMPPPPPPVIEAANALRHRDFVLVGLLVSKGTLFPDNWLYIHDPAVRVGRIQNYCNWSPEMVPRPDHSSIGMEYFCNIGDSLWSMPDAELVRLASSELEKLGLASADAVQEGIVVRQRQAYPVYDACYAQHVATIRDYLETLEHLQTIGRNGLHRYNNLDHSMLTGLLAVENKLVGVQEALPTISKGLLERRLESGNVLRGNMRQILILPGIRGQIIESIRLSPLDDQLVLTIKDHAPIF